MVGLGQPIFVVGLGCSPGFLGFEFAHVRTCFSVVGLGQPIFVVGLGCSLGFLGFAITHDRIIFPWLGWVLNPMKPHFGWQVNQFTTHLSRGFLRGWIWIPSFWIPFWLVGKLTTQFRTHFCGWIGMFIVFFRGWVGSTHFRGWIGMFPGVPWF